MKKSRIQCQMRQQCKNVQKHIPQQVEPCTAVCADAKCMYKIARLYKVEE